MAIGGTRLDRPSAVGDEGRPRAASLTVVALVVIAVLAAAGFLVGDPLLFTSFALFVGLVTAGLVLLSRDRLWPVVLGHLLFLPPACILTALAVGSGLATFAVPGLLFLAVGALLAMFGVMTGWNDALNRETVKTALLYSALSYLLWLVVLVLLLILGALLWGGRLFVLGLTRGSGPVASLYGLLALVGLAAGCLYVAVRALPAIQLTPSHRRPAARERYASLRSALVYLTAGSWGLLVLAVVATLVGAVQALLSLPALGSLVILVTRLTAIPLACVAVLSLLIALGAWVARRATSGFDSVSTGAVGASAAALCYTFALLVSVPALLRFGVVGVGVFFAAPVLPLVVYAGLFVLLTGFYTGAVPGRAASPALAAAGLVSMGLGGGLYGFPSLFVFAAVTGGLVVWDVGTFGLSVTAELGHIPATRRLELFHGVVAVGLGLAGIAVMTLLDVVRRSVGAGIGTPVTLGVAVLGVVLVTLALRG